MNQDTKRERKILIILLLLLPSAHGGEVPNLLGSLVVVSMAMPGPFWQVNLSGESSPQRRVGTISWSNLTGWLRFPFLVKYFAASSTAARPAPAAAQGEHLESTLLTTDKMMSSNYWNETSSSSSCGTQQLPEVLQCQPQHYHCYHQSSQTQQPPEKNLVYERVRTYSGPMNKVVQALDPIGSREVLSPLKSSSSYQNLVWSDRSQELHSPTLKISTCAPNALHITTNTEQELHSPTVKVTSYPQTTIRRYIVQNPEQEPLSPFLRGSHFFPGNNVIYEKTIRKVEKLNMDQECCPQVQCHHHIVQQPQIIHSPHCQQSHSSQQMQTITASDSISTSSGNDLCHGESSHTREQVVILDDGPEKLDPKYFGELLADLSRKNTDLYHCLLEHLQRIGGSKQDFECTDESEDIESLIPTGLSEFTKQQIRYILQMRGMSEKSLRLVLSTFSNIREELRHLQNDLTSLENDKLRLEKDLVFKETQIKEYEALLASVRANNRQQQQGLQDSNSKCQTLEESNLSLRHTLSDMEYRLKEMECCKHNLEQENKNLRMQVSETCTGPMLQAKMDEVGNYYMEMVKNLRMEKDREICKLRTQLNQYQKDVLRREGSCSDFQFKLHELTSLLEEKDSLIKRQSEELSKLRQEIYSSHNQPCSGGRTTITTKKYRTQYPILGLLYDDYEYIPPGSDTHTVVIEKTEDKWTCP